ncbi:hypothetical protein TNCT_711211 [Trichonephila clavata]|uniref:Uncharacterized protein n=1 Tax=Trichonephila clavata TaxID=2740835 RepID=A0A8X6HCG6_TRICU|nr:hypothetical protein TNCT_711211 [Trichonephila clavata]
MAPIVPIMKFLRIGTIFQTVKQISFSTTSKNLCRLTPVATDGAVRDLTVLAISCEASATIDADTVVKRKIVEIQREKRIRPNNFGP